MTTIAVDTKSIACDLQFTHGSGLKFRGTTKVLELSEEVAKGLFGVKKAFIGFAGNADIWGNIVSYLVLPEGKPPRCRDIEFLMLTSDRKIFHGTNLNNWMQIREPSFAIGSGMQYAQAAMALKKTPLEAVKIAAKYDIGTGMGYKQYKL